LIGAIGWALGLGLDRGRGRMVREREKGIARG